jgi:glucose-1-phosphate adenylyltransferase
MDPVQMVSAHVESGAGVTVAGIRVPRAEARRFGIIEVGTGCRITRFREKPLDATGLRDSPNEVFASMGNYVFTTDVLVDALREDAENRESHHDMGGDVVTMLANRGQAAVYDFALNRIPGSTERDRAYWRDVGTLDTYYDSHMDLISVHPVFNLYNSEWPILCAPAPLPPAKFVLGGSSIDSIVAAGAIVSGGRVSGSVLSPGVRIEEGSMVERSVLLDNVRIGPGAMVRNAILDKNVVVPAGASIGLDAELDRKRGFTISDNGIVVVGKDDEVPVPS